MALSLLLDEDKNTVFRRKLRKWENIMMKDVLLYDTRIPHKDRNEITLINFNGYRVANAVEVCSCTFQFDRLPVSYSK